MLLHKTQQQRDIAIVNRIERGKEWDSRHNHYYNHNNNNTMKGNTKQCVCNWDSFVKSYSGCVMLLALCRETVIAGKTFSSFYFFSPCENLLVLLTDWNFLLFLFRYDTFYRIFFTRLALMGLQLHQTFNLYSRDSRITSHQQCTSSFSIHRSAQTGGLFFVLKVNHKFVFEK